MVKHTQAICQQFADELFECVWPFCGVNAWRGKMRKYFGCYDIKSSGPMLNSFCLIFQLGNSMLHFNDLKVLMFKILEFWQNLVSHKKGIIVHFNKICQIFLYEYRFHIFNSMNRVGKISK